MKQSAVGTIPHGPESGNVLDGIRKKLNSTCEICDCTILSKEYLLPFIIVAFESWRRFEEVSTNL